MALGQISCSGLLSELRDDSRSKGFESSSNLPLIHSGMNGSTRWGGSTRNCRGLHDSIGSDCMTGSWKDPLGVGRMTESTGRLTVWGGRGEDLPGGA